MKRLNYGFWTLLLLTVFCTPLLAQVDMSLFSGMKSRSIGPAGMSGRIAAIDAVAADPSIIYVGAATGGVWKSTSGGVTWKPIFDDQPTSSIGAIAIFQPNPSIVWVGTGEGNPRNSMGVGYGIFKSMDAGVSWQHLGLKETERIHRIIPDPKNPNVVYVAALGKAWSDSPERGVFKTTDGGKSWQKVLYIDEKTGCADLVMDPNNPQKLFAAMWEYRRWPWFFESGGPSSGLYVTHDGGASWEQITHEDGLPKGDLGRMGLAIAASNPNIVYALVEAKKSALCRSEDGGHTWKIVNSERRVNPRPFYFCDIYVDPENENRIYGLQQNLVVSNDGGRKFERIATKNHLDHHAMWINPANRNHILDGNDGGVSISYDRGKSWRLVENLPLAQFYHINVDMQTPYNVYGGLQDNGSWRGPSHVFENGGIRNHHWVEVGFGDGFGTLVDPKDPNTVYCMFQGGILMRSKLDTGERKFIRPVGPDSVDLRFNWNAGIAIDPLAYETLYYGSQFLHKSTDGGDTWEIISPDLTTNDPEKQKQKKSGGLTIDNTSAENHTTILTIAPSSIQQGVIWVGTDDGNVQVTMDGGESWKNVIKNIKGVPEATWVPHIEPSKFDASAAFIVFDDHRRGNWATYIYRTDNYGKSWKNIAKNNPNAGNVDRPWGFAHVIEQDPVEKDLLFLGTEFGLWISFDGGDFWNQWTQGLPTSPVRALIVHPREHDLVIGTHGRSVFVLDDIRPLRAKTKELMKGPLHVFDAPSVVMHQLRQVDGYHFSGDAQFIGEAKKYGAMISFYHNPASEKIATNGGNDVDKDKTVADNKAKIEILDESGKAIKKDSVKVAPGVNRYIWNLRRDGIDLKQLGLPPEMANFLPPGLHVIPGTYTAKISFGENEVSTPIEVLADAREPYSLADREAKYKALMGWEQTIKMVGGAFFQVRKTNETLDTIIKQLKDRKDETSKDLVKDAKEVKKKLGAFSAKLMGGGDMMSSLAFQAMLPLFSLSSSFDAPTPSQEIQIQQAQKKLMAAQGDFKKLFAEDVAAFKKKFKEADVDFFKISFPSGR